MHYEWIKSSSSSSSDDMGNSDRINSPEPGSMKNHVKIVTDPPFAIPAVTTKECIDNIDTEN